MAEYIFDRGKFGMYNVSMWQGETQAFKLLRMLHKQGIKDVLYEEGPLCDYGIMDHIKRTQQIYYKECWGGDEKQKLTNKIISQAPEYFKVSF